VTAQPAPDALEPAHQLWAGRFRGVLSTHSLAEPGYPFGSAVPYCLDRRGLPLFLLSHLAQHTRNLDASSRCAFTVADGTEGDIQQSLRLTCLGDCSQIPAEETAAAERYLRYFPDARMYLEALNFRMYRLHPLRFYYNGGFATARWLGRERILRTSDLSAGTEAALLEQVGRRWGAHLQARIAGGRYPTEAVLAVGIDPWGIDLRWGPRLRRIPFPQPLASAADLDRCLTRGAP
jgi:putative heme iron utilization protein